VVSFTIRPLYHQRKRPWYPLDRRLGGPQSRSKRCCEEKNSLPLPGIESPIIQPIGQLYITELILLILVRLKKDKFVPCIKDYAMKMYGTMDMKVHLFLTSTLDGSE
jgi:hypothetical protein